MFVRKLNGDLRTTIDYRRLNAVTTLPASSIPRTQDCVNALAGSEIFSVGDSPAAFHQVPMISLKQLSLQCLGYMNVPSYLWVSQAAL